MYIAVYPNLWLTSLASIGLAFGGVLSQHKFLRVVSLRGVLIPIIAYVSVLTIVAMILVVLLGISPSHHWSHEDEHSTSDFYTVMSAIMDPAWVSAFNQIIGIVLGTSYLR